MPAKKTKKTTRKRAPAKTARKRVKPSDVDDIVIDLPDAPHGFIAYERDPPEPHPPRPEREPEPPLKSVKPESGWDTLPASGAKTLVYVSSTLASVTMEHFPISAKHSKTLALKTDVYLLLTLRMAAWLLTRPRVMQSLYLADKITRAQYDQFGDRWDTAVGALYRSGMYARETLAWVHENEDEFARFKPPFVQLKRQLIPKNGGS